MYVNYDMPAFRGDYFAVGYQHATWWIKYLQGLRDGDYDSYFRRLLTRCWKPRFNPLFENTLSAFPEVITEISGMAQALLDEGYRTSLRHVFANCIGETGSKSSQCTAFVAFDGANPILAHNEEEAGVDPLCIATVTLTGNGSPRRFMAAAYPFQLFGSAFGGVNAYLAFQGNSIGYRNHIQAIEDTWHQRLPKTVITRKWLECSSVREALDVAAGYLFSLPSHHYFLTPCRAYSVEVRPTTKFACHPPEQFSSKILTNIHCHTNHFMENGVPDREWEWKHVADRAESLQRLAFVSSRAERASSMGREQAERIISTVARHREYRHKTSASFVVESVNNGFVVAVSAWFNKTKHVIPILR